MNYLTRILVVSLCTVLSPLATVDAQAKPPKAEPYSVVEVGTELRIVTKSEVAGLRKELDAEYAQAVAEHKQAQKDAAKAKEKYDDPRPVKRKLKTLASNLKSREAAEAKLESIREKRAAKDRKSGAKGGKGAEQKKGGGER